MEDGKEVPTKRMLKYKKGSLNMKFRVNIVRNIIEKAIET